MSRKTVLFTKDDDKFIRIVNGVPTEITDPKMLEICKKAFDEYFSDEYKDDDTEE